MIADQDTLARLLRDMLASRGYRAEDLVHADGRWQLAEPADAIHALVVLDRFELADYVANTFDFLAGLDRDVLERWHRNFTKTLFLLGAPPRIAPRFDIVRHRTEHAAWTVPGSSNAHLGLRRLLKPLATASLPALPGELDVPLPPARAHARRLRLQLVKTRALESYLVHLNHTLCDAFIVRAIAPGDTLRIVHVDEIRELAEPNLYVRVHVDETDHGRLNAYACLAEEGTASA